MILVFGGTTEGRIAAGLLDFTGEPYFYSTKTQTKQSVQGKMVCGTMDADAICNFCNENSIKVIIDAAHPFAINLHRNIANAAQQLNIPSIRFERTYPDIYESEHTKLFGSYKEMTQALATSDHQNILALTGVQTIPHFENLRKDRNCYFRILNTELSREKAKRYGVTDEYVFPEDPNDSSEEMIQLAERLNAQVILTKESGVSGFFESKVEAAQQSGIPLWIVKRPQLPAYDKTVHSKKELLQAIYQLRKKELKLEGELRSGFTTGTCVCTAAKACFIALVEGKFPETVELLIPYGDVAKVIIFPVSLTPDKASCIVIKNGGDDPDATHGKEIGCELEFSNKAGIEYRQGTGVGLVTLPGLQVNVGEPAINPMPRKMISTMLDSLSDEHELSNGFIITPFVPEGEEIANHTFNPRVGVIGGISIIGTTGKVLPYSSEAFLATIRHQISVAKEIGDNEVVLSSGKRSEKMVADQFSHLTEPAFVHFGNFIGDSLKMAVDMKIDKISLSIMFGKGIKLAEGHLDTHSKHVTFNADFAAQLAKECGQPDDIISKIKNLKLANAILSMIPFSPDEEFYQNIAKRCYKTCRTVVPRELELQVILLSDKGEMIKVISKIK